MRISKIAGAMAATALAATMVAGTASAQSQLKLNQVGAALALPVLAGNGNTTYLNITNVGAEDRNLHFNVISGDGWEVTDFDCPVTASETVLITWAAVNPGTAEFRMECNFAGEFANEEVVRLFNWQEGIVFVATETDECKDGSCTTNANDLFGDWVIVNSLQGLAYSAGAVPFQGKDPLAGGVADRDYKFDNSEYAMFPATLATNFIAPGVNLELQNAPVVTADLILFTLDGRANVGSQAALDILFFDDEETPTSAHFELDCFSIVSLENINPNFRTDLLGSGSGHLYMHVIDTDQASNAHDNKFGNGNSIRVVGVHGWLVQTINGDSAFSRTLAQGMLPQDIDGDDTPTLDGH